MGQRNEQWAGVFVRGGPCLMAAVLRLGGACCAEQTERSRWAAAGQGQLGGGRL